MKTKIVLTALALSLSTAAFAQEKISLEKRITNYSLKIDSIVSSERKNMDLELNAAEEKYKNGKISESDLKEERDRISTNYSEKINTKINAEKDSLDEITKESAMDSVMGKNDEPEKNKKKVKTPKELLKTGGLVVSFGFQNLAQNKGSFNFFKNPETINFGRSNSTSITSVRERQIGKYTSPVFINYGLGLRIDSYVLKNNQIFTQNSNQLQLSNFTGGDLKYSMLKESYLEIPVNFSFVLNPKYIDFEGDKYLDATKDQLRFGVGIYGGVRIGNRIRYKYSNAESSKNIFIQKVENGVDPFIFGTKLSIGYAGFNIFVKKDLVSIFNSKANIKEKNGLQIGIELANLGF